MKHCTCGVDHWRHVAGGFQGIVSMMGVLHNAGVEPTPASLAMMKEYLETFKIQIAVLEAAAASRAE